QLQILIGTDVLSRGIDVVGVDLVVNLDVPPDPEDYIHRIGRTARAEREGAAITFVTQKDIRKFVAIERLMNQEVEKIAVPEEIGPTKELVVLRKNIETGKNTHPKRNTNPKGKRPKKFFKNRKKSGGESPAAS